MKEETINLKNNYPQIVILTFFSLLIGSSYPYLQYGIDGGLVLAGIVKYQDFNSPMAYYFFNSWTLIHQFSSLLLQIGLSVESSSKVLMMISTFFFSFGVFLFCYSLTKEKNLSLFIAVVSIVLGKNFGDTDYPSLIFSEHTYGMLSLATFTFILGLIANKNIFFSCLLAFVLFSIHPIVGLWTLLIMFISFYLFNIYSIYKKEIKKGIILGIIFIIFSFILYSFNSIEKIPYNEDLFLDYLENWDGHRSISKLIHYEYLIKTLFLFILCALIFKKKIESSSYSAHIFALLLSLVCSSILYLLYKLVPFIFPEFFKIIMPTRFIMLHTFLGWPLIIATLIFLLKDTFKKKANFFVSILLILILIQNYNKIFLIKNNFISNFQEKEESYVINFLKNENFKTNLIVPSSLVSYVFKKTKKPILLHTESMDFIPYHSYLSDKFFYILRKVYKIENNIPPEQNNPSLSDDYIKNVFENRSKDEWSSIKREFNVEFILIPHEWNLNIKIHKQDEKYKLYKL
jgi:hypothetical protein